MRLVLHVMLLNLPALLTAFTVYCLLQLVCCVCALPPASLMVPVWFCLPASILSSLVSKLMVDIFLPGSPSDEKTSARYSSAVKSFARFNKAAHKLSETVDLLTKETPDFIPATFW